ncbi:hypothetical protein EJB05_38978, partial [Eragrostis curvula]
MTTSPNHGIAFQKSRLSKNQITASMKTRGGGRGRSRRCEEKPLMLRKEAKQLQLVIQHVGPPSLPKRHRPPSPPQRSEPPSPTKRKPAACNHAIACAIPSCGTGSTIEAAR